MAQRLDQGDARCILADCHVARDAKGFYPDYHALNSDRVQALLEVAEERKYRKPRNANGSRGLYWYQHLVRTAK